MIVTPHLDDLSAARAGDHEAFGRLIEARWERLARLARSIVGDADACDIVQESCVACWRHLRQLDDPAKFDSWLLRIVFRRAVRGSRWRRAFTRHFAVLGKAVPDSCTDDPASGLLVRQVLSRLPPRQRAVLYLTAVEGMTDSEIAGALGLRAGTVRAHRRRARETIAALDLPARSVV